MSGERKKEDQILELDRDGFGFYSGPANSVGQGVSPEPETEILRGVYPEPKAETLRFTQGDKWAKGSGLPKQVLAELLNVTVSQKSAEKTVLQ